MKTVIIIAAFFVLVCSCRQEDVNSDIVFYEDYPDSRLWIGENEINIEEMKQINNQRGYIRYSYDALTSKIWAWNVAKELDYFYLADVTDGEYLSEKEISFEIPDKLAPQFVFLFDDFALIEYRWGFYGIADLKNIQLKLLDLRDILKKDDALGTIGFDFENIFFSRGFYNIESSRYFKYKVPIKLPRLFCRERKIVGLDENNLIVIYDYINYSIKETNVLVYDKYPMLEYRPSDLYYLYGEELFFSTTAANLANVFVRFRRPAYREWYVLDLGVNEKIKCFSPSGYAKILGFLQLK